MKVTMSFVNSNGLRTRRRSVLENIFLWRIPENGIIDRGIGQILSHTFDPGRESVNMLPLRRGHSDLHISKNTKILLCYLHLCIVWDGWLTIDSRQCHRPYAVVVTGHWNCLAIPIV